MCKRKIPFPLLRPQDLAKRVGGELMQGRTNAGGFHTRFKGARSRHGCQCREHFVWPFERPAGRQRATTLGASVCRAQYEQPRGSPAAPPACCKPLEISTAPQSGPAKVVEPPPRGHGNGAEWPTPRQVELPVPRPVYKALSDPVSNDGTEREIRD